MPKNTAPAAPKYDVKIHSIRPEGSCKATASVNVYGDFAVRGIKIMEGSKGLFISMPSSSQAAHPSLPCKHENSLVSLLLLFPHNFQLCGSPSGAGNGEYKDICFPCTKEAKAEFDKAVLGAYQQALTQGQTAVQKQESPAQQQEQGQPVMGGM
ncbi:SpoVG family protein [Blautia producta]|uniref:SpoVG family protein n=1 Tax=Blautia producta TaxID=33035 RepID=UPI00210BFA3D|nr:SpoVG family protein [Blautia producta]MCQ5125064.1 SpoVG family protein [Blautia producta]